MNFSPIKNVNHFAEDLRDRIFVCTPSLIAGFDHFTLVDGFSPVTRHNYIYSKCLDIFARYCYSNGDQAILISRSSINNRDYSESLEEIKKSAIVHVKSEMVVAWHWNGLSYQLFLADGTSAAITSNSMKGDWQWVKWES